MNKYLRNFFFMTRIPVLCDAASRDLRHKHLNRHQAYQEEMFPKLYPQGGPPVVLNGPFAGMVYLNEGVWGSITPKWLGSYESTLWTVIGEIQSRGYRRIIDIGCAEGYYAIGLARSFPDAEVFAFDRDKISRRQVQRLWELNDGPGDLDLDSWCEAHTLDGLITEDCLVVADIEGGEMDLLDPAHCPHLESVDLLVEVHRTEDTSVEENCTTLVSRFDATHEVTTCTESDDLPDLPNTGNLTPEELPKATSEGRPCRQSWLWMKAKTDQ